MKNSPKKQKSTHKYTSTLFKATSPTDRTGRINKHQELSINIMNCELQLLDFDRHLR